MHVMEWVMYVSSGRREAEKRGRSNYLLVNGRTVCACCLGGSMTICIMTGWKEPPIIDQTKHCRHCHDDDFLLPPWKRKTGFGG
jgi:hypothetical protein